MCLEGLENVLALWIYVQGIGSVLECVLTHVEDMLAGGYSDVCWSDGSGIQMDIQFNMRFDEELFESFRVLVQELLRSD